MKSVQIGSADREPSMRRSRLSSKPTHTTHRSRLVNPANHPSREVPVFPAAGRLEAARPGPGGRPAAQTSCIMLSTR